MAKSNIFAVAQVVSPKKTAAAKAEKETIEVPGLLMLASIDTVTSALKGLREKYESTVKGFMTNHFVTRGEAKKAKPDNFTGFEDTASASCEARKRSSASGLNDSEAEILNNLSVPFETVSDMPETFIINPKYKDDSTFLERISKVLKPLMDKGLLPEDLIQKQVGTTKNVVTEDTVKKAFTLAGDNLRLVLPIICTLAVKPKIEGEDMEVTIERVLKEMVGGEEEDEN